MPLGCPPRPPMAIPADPRPRAARSWGGASGISQATSPPPARHAERLPRHRATLPLDPSSGAEISSDTRCRRTTIRRKPRLRTAISEALRRSGKEVRSPPPPPLRTGRAPFRRIRLKHRTTPLRGTTGRGSAGPRHPLRDAVSPSALGSTWTLLRQSQLPKIGGGRTTGVAARDMSALPPEPVGCRFTSADTRGKSARFRAG